MAGPVDSISKAISDNRVDNTWTVEKKYSCDTGKKADSMSKRPTKIKAVQSSFSLATNP